MLDKIGNVVGVIGIIGMDFLADWIVGYTRAGSAVKAIRATASPVR